MQPKRSRQSPTVHRYTCESENRFNTNLVSTLPISSDIVPFFIKSNEEGKNSKKARKRRRRMCESSPPSDLLMSWSKPQTRKPRDDNSQCVMIVSKLCGEYLSPADTIVRRRLDSTVYYDKDEIGGEPTVVRAADNKLYIGCYVHNELEERSYFILYDGETNEKVSRLQMPYRIPYGFHGQFVSREDLERHFEYHDSRPFSELKEDIGEEIYRRLLQQMITMLTFP